MIRLLLLLSLSCLTAPARAADGPPPNVVLIFTDDQGYADVGCFGGEGIVTPNLDRMAAEGRRFTNFHVSSAVCSASRAALLTGCLHSRVSIHGAMGPASRTGLNPDEMTIAELLKQKGYATGMYGKWHLGRPPELLPKAQGFDDYFGLPYSSDMWPKHPENPSAWPPLPLLDGDEVVEILDDQTTLLHRLTERAVRFIGENKEKPFFLYFAPQLPHVPLFVRPEFRGKSPLGLYGDVIAEIDHSTGEILTALREAGVDGNTLVIFTSDNGPWLSYGDHSGSAKPLREGKGTSWEGGTRVPCIMRWPGHIPPATACAEPLMTIDIFPTLASLAGAPLPPRKIDGLDITPLLTGGPEAKCPHDFYPVYYADNQLQAILSGPWKLLLPHEYRTMGDQPPAHGGIPGKYRQARVTDPELYHLTDDISESRNVAAANPETVQRLLGYADQARAEFGDSLTGQKGTDVRPAGVASKK